MGQFLSSGNRRADPLDPFKRMTGVDQFILQGMQDEEVPGATQRHALTVVEHLASDLVNLTLIKDGDHRPHARGGSCKARSGNRDDGVGFALRLGPPL
jgi:hypothetical protein